MVGSRDPATELTFPASEAAGRHGASVKRDTNDRSVAYAGVSPPEPRALGRVPCGSSPQIRPLRFVEYRTYVP